MKERDNHDPNSPFRHQDKPSLYPSHLALSLAKLDKDNNDKEICHWNSAEEAVLVHALINEQQEGRQVENGFKPQAWRNVHEASQRNGIRPKTMEQLKSRWQRLKKEYRIVKNLRRAKGFVWDNESALVTGDGLLWESYLDKHPESKPFRKKTFPLYDAIASLVEREGGAPANESFSANEAHWPRKHTYAEGSGYTSLPSSDACDDAPGPSVNSGERSWERDDSVSDEEIQKPDVAYVLHSLKNQECSLRPANFPSTVTLPPIRSLKRTPSDHYPTQTSPSNLEDVTALEARLKRRRFDAAGFSGSETTLIARQFQQPRLHLESSVVPATSLPNSSSGQRSLDSVPACVSAAPISTWYPSDRLPHPAYSNLLYERKQRAWNIVLEEEALSEHELALARRVFRGSWELVDEYLSFPSRCKAARTLWLKREINDLRDGGEE